jgi:hypothetical protein
MQLGAGASCYKPRGIDLFFVPLSVIKDQAMAIVSFFPGYV